MKTILCWSIPVSYTHLENTNDGEDNEDDVELVELLNQLPVTEAVTNQDVNNWMNDDEQCELSKEAIVNLITKNKNSDDEEDDTPTVDNKISHADGLSAIERALLYACLLYTSRCV